MHNHGNREPCEDTPLLTSQGLKGTTEGEGWGQRHILAFMMFMGAFMCYALRVNLSVALVAMVNSTQDSDVQMSSTSLLTDSHNSSFGDNTSVSYTSTFFPVPYQPLEKECISEDLSPPKHAGEFNWSPNIQGIILSSFYYGYITTQIVGGWLAHKFGGKYLFGGGIAVTAILTLVTPVVARTNAYLFIVLRVIEGIGEGCTYPALYVMMSKWLPSQERSKITTFILAGNHLGTVVTQPISGTLCDYGFAGGWPSVFYLFGGIACIWVVLWLLIIHESPENHPRISQAEQKYILNSRCTISDEERLATPWKEILTSPPVIALSVVYFAKGWGHTTLLTVLPTYFKQVLKFDTSQNGFASGLPFLCLWASEIVSGFVADVLRKRKMLNTTQTRKLMTTIGTIFPAAFLLPVGYMGCDGWAGVAVLCAATTFLGIGGAGCPVNHFDIAPHFAGPLVGLVNTFGNLPGVVTPEVAELMSQGQPYASRWRPVFFLSAGLYLVGAVVYLIFGTGEQQEWDLKAFRGKHETMKDSKGRIEGPELTVT